MKETREDEIARIPIEGIFGTGKRRYGWSRIMAKRKNTSESVIATTVLVMNLEKILRDFLLSIFELLESVLLLLLFPSNMLRNDMKKGKMVTAEFFSKP